MKGLQQMKRLTVLATLLAVLGCTTPHTIPGRVGGASGYAIVVTDSLSLAATVRSTALAMSTLDTAGYAVRSTGTASGTWAIQYSNDFVPGTDDPTSDGKWDSYTVPATIPAASGSAQTFGVALDSYEYRFVRLKFTYASGSGTATVIASAK